MALLDWSGYGVPITVIIDDVGRGRVSFVLRCLGDWIAGLLGYFFVTSFVFVRHLCPLILSIGRCFTFGHPGNLSADILARRTSS